jgi:hypothetical protein
MRIDKLGYRLDLWIITLTLRLLRVMSNYCG